MQAPEDDDDPRGFEPPDEEEQLFLRNLAKGLAQQLRPDLFPAPPPPMTASRNDPCPCGSGRKFKRCHGQESP